MRRNETRRGPGRARQARQPAKPAQRSQPAGDPRRRRGGGGAGVRVPESALRFQYARSGGPGGQNVNKVNTKAELWVPVAALLAGGLIRCATGRLRAMAGRRLTEAGEIHIASDTHRTQQANRQAVVDRLRELLVSAMHEPKVRRKTKPSRRQRRRLESAPPAPRSRATAGRGEGEGSEAAVAVGTAERSRGRSAFVERELPRTAGVVRPVYSEDRLWDLLDCLAGRAAPQAAGSPSFRLT